MEDYQHLPTIELDETITIQPVCDKRVYEIRCRFNTRFDYPSEIQRRLDSYVYLREVELRALQAWLSLFTGDEPKDINCHSVVLGGVVFKISRSSEEDDRASRAATVWQKTGFDIDNPFAYDEQSKRFKHQSLPLCLVKSRMGDEYYHLIDATHTLPGLQYDDYTLYRMSPFHPLSKASVTVADRLLGILSMRTAPAGGYTVSLRNGIGELNLIEDTDTLNLNHIVDDLIR